jgi:hypothetical protein
VIKITLMGIWLVYDASLDGLMLGCWDAGMLDADECEKEMTESADEKFDGTRKLIRLLSIALGII